LSSASSLTRFVLKVVRFSVMKILPGSPFRHFLWLYTFSRILYDRKRTITCDVPLWTVPMTYNLLIYSFWIPSSSFWLHTFRLRSSVLTGWIIRPDLSIGTWIFWNRRLVLREYCSWFSSRVSRLVRWYRSPISVLHWFSVCSFEVTLLFVAITSSACFYVNDFCSVIVSCFFFYSFP
jgi:hypothetical protein